MIPVVDPERIYEALNEFDEKHRSTAEWDGWENNRAHKYAIRHDGQLYPVKMVVELATGLTRSQFSGGESPGQAAAYVRERGIEVIRLGARNPNWTRDELILALDVYLNHREAPPGKDTDQILALSRELNALGESLGIATGDDFRNPNGAYMKLMNFRRFDPEYTGQGKVGLTRGGKLEEQIWDEFADNPAQCHAVADAIRNAIGTVSIGEDDVLDEGTEAEEGRLLTAIHRRRERSRKIVQRKKESVLRKMGRLRCEACGFDFAETYGKRGEGFIECHHVKPVSESTGKTTLGDLVLLCANCHRMVHARRPWLSLNELVDLVRTT